MDTKPNINVVNNFYIFEKSSKSMSSSVEAKPKTNVVKNKNNKIYQIDQKPAKADADRNGFKGVRII
jgi:hypothetical protein